MRSRSATRYAKAYLAAGTANSPATGVGTVVQLDTLETSGDGFSYIGYKLTVSRAGLYLVQAGITWQIGGGTGMRSTAVRKNGATIICVAEGSATDSGHFTGQSCSVLTRLVAGDYLELLGTQGSGAGLVVLGGSNGPTFLSVMEAA